MTAERRAVRAPTFKLLATLGLALAVPLTTGCSYSIHEVFVSDFEPGVGQARGKVVTAEADKRIILGFADNSDYADRAYRELMDRCKGGELQGITTQFSTAHGFFSWTSKIRLEGLCVK
jgi:hypothetical protein